MGAAPTERKVRVIQEPRQIIGLAHADNKELIPFTVHYHLPDLNSAGYDNLIEVCARHGIDLHNTDHMKDRFQQILFAEKRDPETLINPLFIGEYKQAFDNAAANLSDAQCRAIGKWTNTENSYTGDLNDALSHFAETGESRAIPNPEDESRVLNIHQEVASLNESLALLPRCNTVTLRIAHVTDPRHRQVYPDKIAPGMLASNYPRFMSASSKVISNNDLMEAFEGNPDEIVLISELHGATGKPLGEFNPANEIEEEVLFGPDSVFVLAGTAKAVPDSDDHTTRVAVIYIEVNGPDPTQVPNLHTGETPRFIPQRRTEST
jgi:hypothetical protein